MARKKPPEMKKAKVSKGVVRHVWPWTKTLPDGTKVIKELPLAYRGLNGKPVPDCIVDVPAHVKPGFRWNGTEYAPIPKKELKEPRSAMVEIFAEKLGVSYEDLVAEILERKKANRA